MSNFTDLELQIIRDALALLSSQHTIIRELRIKIGIELVKRQKATKKLPRKK